MEPIEGWRNMGERRHQLTQPDRLQHRVQFYVEKNGQSTMRSHYTATQKSYTHRLSIPHLLPLHL
jgi:hypothetical protein